MNTIVCLVAIAVQQPDPVVGGYIARFEDPSSTIAAVFGQELMRISPDGKFNLFRMEVEGTWVRAGDTLVLTPTKVMGQSPDTLRASLKEHATEMGEEAESLVDLLVNAFAMKFNLTVEPGGVLHQGPSMRSLEPFDWVPRDDPPLLEQLTAMGYDDDRFDMALYAYYFIGIEDNIEELTPELISILHSDADWSPRGWAATMLQHSRSPEAVPALMRHVVDDHRVVRFSSEQALVQIGDKTVLPRLIDLNKTSTVRYSTVAELIGKTKASEHLSVLVEGLESEEQWDRRYALEALAIMPQETGVQQPIVAKVEQMAAKDEDSGVRVNAAIVVAKWAPSDDARERAFQTLLSHLTTPDWLVRIDAVNGVAVFGFRAVRELLPLLKDDMGPIRRDAARALGEIGAPAALPALREAFKIEEDTMAREAMFGAIKKLEAINA